MWKLTDIYFTFFSFVKIYLNLLQNEFVHQKNIKNDPISPNEFKPLENSEKNETQKIDKKQDMSCMQ